MITCTFHPQFIELSSFFKMELYLCSLVDWQFGLLGRVIQVLYIHFWISLPRGFVVFSKVCIGTTRFIYLTWIGPGLFTQACYSSPPTCILPLVAIINAQWLHVGTSSLLNNIHILLIAVCIVVSPYTTTNGTSFLSIYSLYTLHWVIKCIYYFIELIY